MKKILYNCRLVLPDSIIADGSVVIDEHGKIDYAGSMEELPEIDDQTIDLSGKTLSPGFIDIHVHGGNGVTFGEGDLAASSANYSQWVTSNGVTGYLMSVAEKTSDALLKMIEKYVEIFDNPPTGAEILGLHLEGPFLNVEKKGAFHPEWLRSPDVDEMKAYIKAGGKWIRQMTMAPELPDAEAVAQLCKDAGILVAMGHTNNDFEGAEKALKGSFQHVTHTFNAQRGFNHREPGVFGAILVSDEVTAELIADTVHVHPSAMRLLLRCLGSDRVVAITDAMAGSEYPNGVYPLGGYEVYVKDGRATLDNGTLAGSVATLNQCVANLINHVGLSLVDAIKLASLNPARVLGLDDRLGSIEKGKDANLTVIDDHINVLMTFVNGHVVYNQMG